MLDWNQNGKIDPVDIGISMGLDADEAKPADGKKPKDCFTSCLVFIMFAVSTIVCIGRLVV